MAAQIRLSIMPAFVGPSGERIGNWHAESRSRGDPVQLRSAERLFARVSRKRSHTTLASLQSLRGSVPAREKTFLRTWKPCAVASFGSNASFTHGVFDRASGAWVSLKIQWFAGANRPASSRIKALPVGAVSSGIMDGS